MTARGIQRGVICGLATIGCLAGLVAAPQAAADDRPPPGSPERNYLEYLALHGTPNATPQRLIDLGYLACNVRRGGGSDQDARLRVFQDFYAHGNPLTWATDSPHVVTAAVATLCPDVGSQAGDP